MVLNIEVLLDESRANDVVDVGNSLCDTLSTPLGLVSVTELNSLVLTCMVAKSASSRGLWKGQAGRRRTGGSAGWDDGTVKASLGDYVNLNGWVTPRVVDRTSVDLGDGHDVLLSAGIELLVDKRRARVEQRRVKLTLCIGRSGCSGCEKKMSVDVQKLGRWLAAEEEKTRWGEGYCRATRSEKGEGEAAAYQWIWG